MDKPGLSVGKLREAITRATEGGGAWGRNLHPSKSVVLRRGELTRPLRYADQTYPGGVCLSSLTSQPEADIDGLRGMIADGVDPATSVLVWIGGRATPLWKVTASFLDGSFVLALDACDD